MASGSIITDAQSSDELVLKLLVSNYTDQSESSSHFLTLVQTFYSIGIEKSFLSESCEILDEEICNWYFDVLFREHAGPAANSAEFRKKVFDCLKTLCQS